MINSLMKKEGYNFDVVCVHDWLSSISGLIIKNETKIPVVFHVHSTEFGRSGGCGSEVVSHLEWAMANVADRIVTVSYVMKEDLIRHGWPSQKISVVWNGVDPEKYNPANCKPEEVERLRESYGIKPDEKTMSMAKPVVVGGHGVVGFKEQVIALGPDQNGVHVNGNNPADIAWGIKQVLCDSERAKKWGENGRKRVLRYFTWRKAAEQTLEVYKAVISDVGVLTVEKEVKKTLS